MSPSRPYQSHDPTAPLIRNDEAASALWLIVLHGGDTRVISLAPGARLTVGRLDSNDVCIPDPSISRAHAEITVAPQSVSVRDLESQNGVRVRNRRLARDESVEIAPGESMQIGAATLLVQSGARPPVAEHVTPRSNRSEAAAPMDAGDGDLVVKSEAMRALMDMVRVVAPSEINVLILGETGVGKERIAESVHRLSRRASKPFLRLNCAAIAPTLLESELFGHEKGAFTGAMQSKPGLLETASGGTVFLDEIGEMPTALQAKLLRVLEDRTVMRVGALAAKPIDVRFVAATHRDLHGAIATGTFRQDLFYRLNGISLSIPPLRDRRDEIEDLARRFASQSPMAQRRVEFAPEAIAKLTAYGWPGNIRELRNAIERAVVLAGGGTVRLAHLPPEIAAAAPPAPMYDGAPAQSRTSSGDLRDELASLERQRIIDALAQCNGNQSRAAELIGMPRRTFLARLEQYGIPRPRKKE